MLIFLDFAVKTVRLMEDHISTCLKNLSDLKLSLITDLLESYQTVAELKPSITRSYLCKVKEEISNASLDSTRKEYGINSFNGFDKTVIILSQINIHSENTGKTSSYLAEHAWC